MSSHPLCTHSYLILGIFPVLMKPGKCVVIATADCTELLTATIQHTAQSVMVPREVAAEGSFQVRTFPFLFCLGHYYGDCLKL
jgi:hypothetical protein